jgi:hypothetical protein
MSQETSVTQSAAGGESLSMRWFAALAAAGCVAWLLTNLVPIRMDIPAELQLVDMYSPREKQEERARYEADVYWKNTLVELSLLGLVIGIGAAAGIGRQARHPRNAMVFSAIGGVIFGVIAAFSGMGLRQWFNLDYPLPLVESLAGSEARPLIRDTVMFMWTGVLLSLPAAVALSQHRVPAVRQKAGSVPLAGLLAGMALPILVSLVAVGLKTNEFPPRGLMLSALWLGLLVGLIAIIPTLVGGKRVKPVADGGNA